MNPIYSLIELRQSHHYYHHFSTLMVLLVYGYLVYFIDAALTITFLYLLSCKAISHIRIVALVLFSKWCKCLVCVELYQRLIEIERTFILPLAPRWVWLLLIKRASHDPLYLWDITPHENALGGGLYIDIFTSSWVVWDEDGRHRSLDSQMAPGGAAWPRAHATSARWSSWPTSLTSCSLKGSHDKILMPEKSQINLSLGRFLKRQNTQNNVFLFCRVITKIRGTDGKSP
jgi:hypothetical protein